MSVSLGSEHNLRTAIFDIVREAIDAADTERPPHPAVVTNKILALVIDTRVPGFLAGAKAERKACIAIAETVASEYRDDRLSRGDAENAYIMGMIAANSIAK